ncbi:MAG TPA: hypothetical protein VIO95_07010, partial [Mycobacterium sp.]
AAAALGAAAIVSAASAPTARADDFSTILADIQATEGIAATAFANAATDFSTGNTAAGLTNLFIGLDDDTIGVPDELQVGLVDASTNSTLFPSNSFDFTFATPATFTASVTEAQTFWTLGNNLATTIGTLPNNDFADAALDNALSQFDQWVAPGQIELVGELQLLLSSLPAEALTAF